MLSYTIKVCLLALVVLVPAQAFLPPVLPTSQKTRNVFRPTAATTGSSDSTKTTLTDETTWNMRFIVRGAPTKKGKKVDEIFTIKACFVEEAGYEPPQGVLKQLQDGDKDPDRLQIVSSRWQLSEDPEDRKDGLWVWGLFKEPLYPFLLLKLETAEIPLTGQDNEDAIQPLQLFAQMKHKRDENIGVVLDGTTELKIRQIETINADPLGVSKVDIYNELGIGTLSVQAVAPKVQTRS